MIKEDLLISKIIKNINLKSYIVKCITKMANITQMNNFDITRISTSEVITNKKGMKTVYMKYSDTNKKIILQTPFQLAPFGLSEFVTDLGPKYSVDVSFSEKDTNEKVMGFYNILQSIDKLLVTKGVENSKKWFGKQMNEDMIYEFYRPLVKEGKEKKNSTERYAETVKFKVRMLNGNKNVECYNTEKDKIEIDELSPGSKVRCIVEISPIWFVNKTFGVSLNLLQIEIEKPERIQGFAFEDD